VLTARKLVRLVFHLLSKGVLYKSPEERKEEQSKAEQSETATTGETVRHIIRRRLAKAGQSD
jgi:hypothetical protein